MGVYNTYAGVQLKNGSSTLEEFKIGDVVDLPDGIYVGQEGFVIVGSAILMGKFKTITTKWGDVLQPEQVLEEYHPLKKAMQEVNKVSEK